MTLALLNPHAQGGRVRRLAPALRAWLRAHAPEVAFAAPEGLDEALGLIARQARGTRIVAIGGDGTVNRWLPALLAGDHGLGLVPLGSGNDIARDLGVYGMPWSQALAHALTAPLRAMDTGWVHVGEGAPVPFLSSLSAGFDAAVGRRAAQGPRWLRGQPRYLWATLQELLALRHWTLHLQPDDGTDWQGRVLLASVLNTATYGSGMPVAPGARTDDGQLDALRALAVGRAGVLRLLPRLLRGTHLADPRVSLSRCTGLSVRSATPLPLAVDGEYLGVFLQCRLGVAPASLRVACRRPGA